MKRIRCPKCDAYITFDETKYEIVDISTSMRVLSYSNSDEFYIVTYKTISE